MAAAFSSIIGQPRAILSASSIVYFSQIRKPANFRLQNWRGIMVNSYPQACTVAMVRGDNVDKARDDNAIDPEVIDVPPELQERDFTADIDGVTIECWWGIMEAHAPHRYNWSGYKRLFKIVLDINLKVRVVMSFHECESSVSDDVWVTQIGYKKSDIFFTDRDLRRNHECLTQGIDKERVLRGRTALEVYFDLMRSF
ncbi:hypothetical protein K7X08_012820 [Anisodus acutangulus]|uniref:Beta-amylase n=1 Tax=Anisodus acutangulus TaxID=402998 RepID=A0A9Q1MD95_9SOLA|nr:hypothetical protein K7X08_012820 [Anisodus acutangulus]